MGDLPKNYDPRTVEPQRYQEWLERGDFKADAKSSKPAFSIVIPPPNITGMLTLGHVLNNTIQDILARRARMQGFEVLWLPGVDHAGVATQTAVEKFLWRTEKKRRRDFEREEFLKRVVEWQDKHGGIIIQQLKRLGCSCDWSRQRYTLDDAYARAVQAVFVDLYKKGLIYRGRRMINWDPAAQTALSDEEVIPKAQKGTLFYVRYELVKTPGRFLEVATTRPETIMADTGLAVHPNDQRYKDLIGQEVWRPLKREKIPIVADDAIDPKFGTGVLKVTPAHDKIDFAIGQRHKLPVIDVLHADGRINCTAIPELDGLDRFAAREKAGELLAQAGLLGKTEPYENNVGFSERSEVAIEPRLSEQWFLHYPKTDEALAVVRDHLIRFFPKHWEKVYAQWLEKIEDWCISRQIWWGHRIPAWYRKEKSEIYVGLKPPADAENWTQDPDTLDTWFSSWLWAYETMDEETRRKFYPTSVLVTAPDIIFFWVARMIIAGLEFQPGQGSSVEENIPFRDVYFTGLIRDKQGRKMSKSLGNSPDPIELMEKYGADGLRFALMRIAPSGQDIRFDEKQIEEGRNFATKLWNAARFRQMHGVSSGDPKLDPASLSIYAVEVLARLNETISGLEGAYAEYQFNAVAQKLYDFFWNDYCDWFVEAAKSDIFSEDPARKASALAVMDVVLSATLRLLHPLMPHVTEELWQLLGFGKDSIQFVKPPAEIDLPSSVAKQRSLVRSIYDAVQSGRNLRSEAKIPSNKKARFVLRFHNDEQMRGELPTLARLLNAEDVMVDSGYKTTPADLVSVTTLGEIILPAAIMDVGAERDRLQKEIDRLEAELKTVRAKLSNKSFTDRAPQAVVKEHHQRERAFEEQLNKVKSALAGLG
jgi:valyl-tRNA synthetase